MNWVTVFLFFAFGFLCLGNQEASDIIKSTILRQNLADKNLRLDPLLRKALLKALVELEKEAEEKLRAEESRNVRSEPNDSVSNFLHNHKEEKTEIQRQAESSFAAGSSPNDLISGPLNEVSGNSDEKSTFTTGAPVTQSTFQYSTTPTVENEISNLVEDAKSPGTDTVIQSSIETNFIPDDDGRKEKTSGVQSELANENKEENKEGKKTEGGKNEVDIFKAPLVAAFTLHQDSKGTPHSVIPLFSKQHQRLSLADQQYALYKQQQQHQQQQFLQNQFIPSVTLTPLPQINHFSPIDSARYFVTASSSPTFAPSTVFPPLVSNSILQQPFTPIQPQTFDSTTLAPFKSNNANIFSTLAPQRNFSPDSFARTILPPLNSVSVVQSHSINLTPTPPQNFPLSTVTPQPRLQPINIPPVTLPLQNEGRFQSPIIVPSPQTNQAFLDSQQEQERIRNRLLAEEQNRKRILEEQHRQRQIQEQNRQRQFEEERQRQLYETQLRLRQQRQEHGVDFQRSVGFTFNPSAHSNFRAPLRTGANNGFNFHIQPSQSFISPVNFLNGGSHHRVNRQEGFGSTGNFGFSNQQISSNNYQFQSNQLLQQLPEYRTIPDEHYRNTPITQYNQNRFNQFGQQQQQQQQQQQFNNFERHNPEDVNKRLKNLLYQSGVTPGDVSGQEDLNIVSKVLSLNHARSDTNVDETVLDSEKVQTPKSLAVGEIKDAQTAV